MILDDDDRCDATTPPRFRRRSRSRARVRDAADDDPTPPSSSTPSTDDDAATHPPPPAAVGAPGGSSRDPRTFCGATKTFRIIFVQSRSIGCCVGKQKEIIIIHTKVKAPRKLTDVATVDRPVAHDTP
jgi:hypothetical protein